MTIYNNQISRTVGGFWYYTIKVLDIDEYEGAVVVFDDTLNSNQRTIDPFLARGPQKEPDVEYLTKSFFDLSRNISNKLIFKQMKKMLKTFIEIVVVLIWGMKIWGVL